MSHRNHVSAIVALVLFAWVPSARAEKPLPTSLPADQLDVQTAVTFSKPGGKVLNLDMARPKKMDGPAPAVVCLFGGGWMSGSRTAMARHIRYLAGYGYVAVAPTYRLAPQDPFPAAVADVRNCVRWLRAHAKEYNIDPEHIGAMGMSAGGHLALMLGVTSDDDKFGRDDVPQASMSAKVEAVVNYFGPGDLASKDWSSLAIKKYLVPFLGGTLADEPENYRRASPVSYLSKDDAPVLTLQGEKDRTVPPSIARELHEKLQKAGITNHLEIVPDQDHGWRGELLEKTHQQMVRFFNAHLKNAGATRPAESAAQ